MNYVLLFSFAALLSLGITPLVRLFAVQVKALDHPAERKIHTKPVPLLGGIAVFLAFNGTLCLWYVFFRESASNIFSDNWHFLPLFQLPILILGIYDDIRPLRPRIKFSVEVLAAIIVVASGFGINSITNPLNGQLINLGAFAVPLTIIWIVGITNAINLVDGLDGLAAGTTLIVSVTIFFISVLKQNTSVAFLAVILAGTVLGFLRYNFFPARIFLGDSGSLLLGFSLAVLSMAGASKGATVVAVTAPILLLGLPILDTILSMARRLLRSLRLARSGENGKTRVMDSMFEADRDHVHHRLLKKGYSHKGVVIILYSVCALLCLLALVSVALQSTMVLSFLTVIVIIGLMGIRNLSYEEFKILENGLLLPLVQIPVINKKAFLVFTDFVAICFSLYLSYKLCRIGGVVPNRDLFLKTFAFVLLFKICVFYFGHLYRRAWFSARLGDFLATLKVVLISSLLSAFGLAMIFGARTFGSIFFVLDFYFLMTFMFGSRISYRVISLAYRRPESQKEKKVLIYGAGENGLAVLQEIRQNDAYIFSPIGFIDDDYHKIGRLIHGCPVLGSIDDLGRILKNHSALEIIISTNKINREKIAGLIDLCKEQRITLRRFEFRFYEFP